MNLNTVGLAHAFLQRYVHPGDCCIDATAGRGRDAAFLAGLVGEPGQVLAFDIQRKAVEATKALLVQQGFAARAQVILDSHANMGRYAKEGTVRAVVFNFGYLPGGDHTVFTHAQSSIPALEAALRLLMPGGVMSLSIYYGGDTGYAERDAILAFLQTVDPLRYTVLIGNFANRPHEPPMPVFIWKE